MWTIISSINPRVFIGIVLVIGALLSVSYVNGLKSDIEDKNLQLENEKMERKETQSKLDEANENNQLIIQAYEKTLAIEKEIASQKAVTTEQKEVVVTKYKTLIKEVEKRGEIKQDEKSNFTIVTF